MAPADSTLAQELRRQCASITGHADSVARGSAIKAHLTTLGLPYEEQAIPEGTPTSRNIVVRLAPDRRHQILLGGHYDQVSVGSGAVDNAASCAFLLQLLARFKAQPLERSGLTVAFFDLEEGGLTGSKSFVGRAVAADKEGIEYGGTPDLCLIFDVFAYGDTLWAHTTSPESALGKAAREACAAAGFPLKESQVYPPGDHLSFLEAEVPTAALSLLPGREIDTLIDFLSGTSRGQPPEILRLIHTPQDSLEKVDAAAMARALPAVEALIRRLDRG